MSIFRRKQRTEGKGLEETVTFKKEFEVLNCTPVDYKYTIQYVNFVTHAPTEFDKQISKMTIDDQCGELLDTYIAEKVNREKQSAKEQYTYHMHVIRHHLGLLDGEIVAATGHLLNLEDDLKALEQEIETYKQLKKEKNIY
jgi:hypothetical protein